MEEKSSSVLEQKMGKENGRKIEFCPRTEDGEGEWKKKRGLRVKGKCKFFRIFTSSVLLFNVRSIERGSE